MNKIRKFQIGNIIMPKPLDLSTKPKSLYGDLNTSLYKNFKSPLQMNTEVNKTQVSNSLMSNIGTGVQSASSLLNLLPSKQDNSSINNVSSGIRSNVNNMLLQSGNPWAMAAGALNTVIDKTGGFTDASKGLGGVNDTLNFASSLLVPGAGWFTKKTNKYNISDTLKSSSSYTGSAKKATDVQNNLSGKKFSFGRIKANNKIAEAFRQDALISDNINTAKLNMEASIGSTQHKNNQNQLNLSGGWSQKNGIRFGKVGMKLYDLSFVNKVTTPKSKFEKFKDSLTSELKKINNLEELWKNKGEPSDMNEAISWGLFKQEGNFTKLADDNIDKFESGGKMNVIPEGSLHSQKHSIELEDCNITKKGIPVIQLNKSNKEQIAEVEKEEIIFTKEITDKLEELCEKGTDEAAIEAGKLLVYEILFNTQDNTGIINKIQD